MKHIVDNTGEAREKSSFFRRSIMVMATIAVFGYVVAFMQADRGTVHYNAYVAAYTNCFHHIVDNGAEAVDCNFVPDVRAPLILHREAYAAGEPFLNLALSLTAAIILSPLFRSFSSRLLDWIMIGDTVEHRHTAHKPA